MRLNSVKIFELKCEKNPPQYEADHLFKDNIQKILLFDSFD
jgi:hypothetical protein